MEEAIILAQRVVIMSARPGRVKEIVKPVKHPLSKNAGNEDDEGEFLDLESSVSGDRYTGNFWKYGK